MLLYRPTCSISCDTWSNGHVRLHNIHHSITHVSHHVCKAMIINLISWNTLLGNDYHCIFIKANSCKWEAVLNYYVTWWIGFILLVMHKNHILSAAPILSLLGYCLYSLVTAATVVHAVTAGPVARYHAGSYSCYCRCYDYLPLPKS